jgi:transglutaminase-like putative cysteine protease
MPLPQSNIYQTVENVSYTEGKVLSDKNYGNKALYVNREEFVSSEYIMDMTFDIRTKKMVVDVSRINNIMPYDPKSEACKLYLGDRGEYIVTSNPYIVKTGDALWAESKNVLDYAQRCYEYVASNFKYVKGSWRTLEQILKDGGGECGDFSTLVVNLLRYKGIPSRHNICVTVGGGYHVWVDFYLEGFGWIPLDATYKNGNPKGDFFGKYDGECIILMQDLCYDFGNDEALNVDVLQTYYYWYWYDSGDCDIKGTHKVSRIKKLVNE